MKAWIVALFVVLTSVGMHAEAAKRLGGGKSVGQQSTHVQREAAPAAPAAPPAQGAANQAAKPATPAATPATPAPQPKRGWGGMLGGLAAGLGLAWLAHSLGFGEAFGQVMLMALMAMAVMAMAVMAVVAWFLRRRVASAPQAQPYAYAGGPAGVDAPATQPKGYRPENVGNDASARPWERSSMGFLAADPAAAPNSAQGGSIIGSALAGSQSWGVPAGFDTNGFLAAAKSNFVTLQAAWDRADIASLRSLMTDGMVQEIQTQLAQREAGSGAGGNTQTDVVMLEARLLGVEELPSEYMASVEFSGMIREDGSAGPSPFREVWNMTKPRDGSRGWLVAGVQSLQ